MIFMYENRQIIINERPLGGINIFIGLLAILFRQNVLRKYENYRNVFFIDVAVCLRLDFFFIKF